MLIWDPRISNQGTRNFSEDAQEKEKNIGTSSSSSNFNTFLNCPGKINLSIELPKAKR